MQSIGLRELWHLAHGIGSDDPRRTSSSCTSRFAYPTACLVLMLVGVPLGLSSKRGGKGTGFVVTLLLVFLYYFLSSVGIALARQDKVPRLSACGERTLLFAAAGVLLIQQMSRGGMTLRPHLRHQRRLHTTHRPHPQPPHRPPDHRRRRHHAASAPRPAHPLPAHPRRVRHGQLPAQLRPLSSPASSCSSSSSPSSSSSATSSATARRWSLSATYLLNLIPFILYNVTPLCSLVAVLITFGALNRTSELTAMKATGTSLYRIVAPVLVRGARCSPPHSSSSTRPIFPAANRRQEALLSVIKGKPAQTFLRPDRKWMSGQTSGNGEPTRIFYYQFFDPDQERLRQPHRLRVPARHLHPHPPHLRRQRPLGRQASTAGSSRTAGSAPSSGESVASYQPFTVTTFPEIHEQPSYFKKEDRQSQEMSYTELSDYIQDLKQSGFDTMRLRVQLNRKLAYPLITLVMAILAIPFSLVAGKRGSIAGMGTAIGVAIAYWVVAGIFENLGNVNSLPDAPRRLVSRPALRHRRQLPAAAYPPPKLPTPS